MHYRWSCPYIHDGIKDLARSPLSSMPTLISNVIQMKQVARLDVVSIFEACRAHLTVELEKVKDSCHRKLICDVLLPNHVHITKREAIEAHQPAVHIYTQRDIENGAMVGRLGAPHPRHSQPQLPILPRFTCRRS